MIRNGMAISILLLLVGCPHPPSPPENSDRCRDPKAVEQRSFSIAQKIDQAESVIKEDVLRFILPYGTGFNVDSRDCKGYTKRILDETKRVATKRKDVLYLFLIDICSQISEGGLDIMADVVMQEQINEATNALLYLKEPVDKCTVQSAPG